MIATKHQGFSTVEVHGLAEESRASYTHVRNFVILPS